MIQIMENLFRLTLLALAALLLGCSTVPRDNWVPSPNFNERKPNYVIIHQTDSISYESSLDILTNPVKAVSAHYLIAKNGHITQLVEEKNRAWHAGKSWWGGQIDMNSASIGIELDHNGEGNFEPVQIVTLLKLLKEINERHKIPVANYLAHGDVAPGRKVDPNRHFPWSILAEKGFGIWCNSEESATSSNLFDPLLGLQALGYDISDPDSAVLAFKRHYRSDDSSAQLTEDDLHILCCLLKKKSLPLAGNAINDQ